MIQICLYNCPAYFVNYLFTNLYIIKLTLSSDTFLFAFLPRKMLDSTNTILVPALCIPSFDNVTEITTEIHYCQLASPQSN